MDQVDARGIRAVNTEANQLAIVSSMVAVEGIFEPAEGDWSITALCGHCGAET